MSIEKVLLLSPLRYFPLSDWKIMEYNGWWVMICSSSVGLVDKRSLWSSSLIFWWFRAMGVRESDEKRKIPSLLSNLRLLV